MDRITGGHLLVRALKARGINRVYSIPGAPLFPFYEGCLEEGMEIIVGRHEEAVVHTAEGWSRATGEPSVVLLAPVTPRRALQVRLGEALEGAHRVFAALDQLEARLAENRFLFPGGRPVEADWRLFCSLIRFDAVYHGHFKCNLRRILDYRHLHGYMLDLYQQPGIAETVNLAHIQRHYYYTHDDINPTRIIPIGPLQDLHAPPGRAHLG